MTAEQIVDNNELIAQFEGWELIEADGIMKLVKDGYRRYHYELKYHSSWGWLMPVVEKIGQTRVKSAASYNSDLMFRIEIVNGYTKIEGTGQPIFYNSSVEGSMRTATYKAVVEFIKWFNQQKQ